MEEMIAECLRAYEESGQAGLRAYLEAHPAERTELEAHLRELRRVGLLGAESGADIELADDSDEIATGADHRPIRVRR